jgi:hypothetical protein
MFAVASCGMVKAARQLVWTSSCVYDGIFYTTCSIDAIQYRLLVVPIISHWLKRMYSLSPYPRPSMYT